QGQRLAVVRSYMAHHQGMSLVALKNVLMGDLMASQIHADPMAVAAHIVRQERIPADSPVVEAAPYEPGRERSGRPAGLSLLSRRLTTPANVAPPQHLLQKLTYYGQ